MNNTLEGIKPEKVMYFFEKLTEIPRGSGNEKEVSDYLVEFAKKRNLEVKQDESLNVIIKKPGNTESDKRVILQGHMDIVCAKEENKDFDFENDPIDIYVDRDMIKANGTTLGGDNGIAVAMSLAILDSNNIKHPDLTVLVTTEEETGMGGVLGLKKDSIEGDILINIDSEEEGTILASCAGGVRSNLSLPISFDKNPFNNSYEIKIDGLLGGHSGMEIDKRRGSSIKIIGRILRYLSLFIDFSISNISGGEKMNAIAKRCSVYISTDDEEKLKNKLNEIKNKIIDEYSSSDSNLEIFVNKVELDEKVINQKNLEDLINILRLIPQGIQTMSADMEGLVESSSNVGVINLKDNKIELNSAVRSSVKSLKNEITDRIDILATSFNAKHELVADYPSWKFEKKSYIRNLMKKVYKDKYNNNLEVEAIHAGLECGFLKEKLGDIDMVSLGPNLYDVHTPDEKLSISSTKRVYEFLLDVLKEI